jgi:hypothetical protein
LWAHLRLFGLVGRHSRSTARAITFARIDG